MLRTLADESVHCVVTSPPYWGLRDYGTATWEDGDEQCNHLAMATGSTQNKGNNGKFGVLYRERCRKCGAGRIDGQIGLEATPELYVTRMVEGFREIRRILRKDGTCWLNLGDTYNSGGGTVGAGKAVYTNGNRVPNLRQTLDNLKPKNLCGIPWRVAFALQADGWWLRQDIIWSKPNPMPESVTDRCTKAHEYIFLLTKSERYYYDAEAVKELAVEGAMTFNGGHEGNKDRQDNGRQDFTPITSRNKRSVWEIATSPFPEAHFATFPPKLVEPCILAGTSERGCCAECGAPWVRMVEAVRIKESDSKRYSGNGDRNDSEDGRYYHESRTVGWQPTCNCNADAIPCTVLDPFNGAGTTGLEALRLGRDYIGIELNSEYVAMTERRIREDSPLFNYVEVEAGHGGAEGVTK